MDFFFFFKNLRSFIIPLMAALCGAEREGETGFCLASGTAADVCGLSQDRIGENFWALSDISAAISSSMERIRPAFQKYTGSAVGRGLCQHAACVSAHVALCWHQTALWSTMWERLHPGNDYLFLPILLKQLCLLFPAGFNPERIFGTTQISVGTEYMNNRKM